jgi:hypothetical protein
VKKCASCTKDLPDAALHCVFCGAKQPPAPAIQPGLARTAFGYSANEVAEQLRGRGGVPPAPRTAPAPVPPMPQATPPVHNIGNLPTMLPAMPPARSAPISPAMASTAVPPPTAPPMVPPPPTGPFSGGPQGGYVPTTAANAKTMFVQAGPQAPASPAYPPPSSIAATLVPPPPQPLAVPVPVPTPGVRPAPIMAIPQAQPPPYLASQTASRLIRPIEPWRDGLRAWMFLGGLALLAAFAVPLHTSPALQFNGNLILDGQGIARLPPLMLGAVGLLGIVFAILPMPVWLRGLLATLLGLAGIAVPIALVAVPPWQVLAPMIGLVLLVPSLLVRSEYRDALLARLLVTIGAVGILLPFAVPQNSAIPLVGVFKQLIDLPGAQKVAPALELSLIVIVVMSLLAWLPSPVTGGAKVWAWLLILWALFVHVIHLVLAGGIGAAISGAPNQAILAWVAGGGGALGSAYLVLIGYGLASVIGKQLE